MLKENKLILVLVLVLCLVGGLYWLAANAPKLLTNPSTENLASEISQNEIKSLLIEMKSTTQIKFSEPTLADFNWKIESEVAPGSESLTINGQAAQTQAITEEQIKNIKEFFLNKKFEINSLNTEESATGFSKGKTICLLTILQEIKVECGKLPN